MNHLKQLAGQTAIYGLSSVISRVLNFLLVPFYTRIFLDPAQYGVINELYAYVAFLIIILTYGMETAFFRFTSKYRNSPLVFSTAFVSVFTTSLLFAITVTSFYPSIANVIGYGGDETFVLLLGLVLAIDAAAALPFARLRYRNKALKFAMIKLFNICVNIFFNLFFLVFLPWLYDGEAGFVFDPSIGVGYVFISNLLASSFTFALFLNEIFNTKLYFSFRLFKKMISYSFPLLIAGLAGTVNEVIDRIMLRFRLPEEVNALEQIGIYGANIKIAVLMTLFIQMFRYAFEPFFFSHARNTDSRKIYAEVLHYFAIFGIFVFLGITLFIDIFKYIIGEEYRQALAIVPIVLLGNYLLGIYYNFSVWYKLKDATYWGAIFATSGALVTIAINYFLIPHYGFMASAWGHFFAYAVMVILVFLIGRHHYPVPYNIKAVAFYTCTGIILYLISRVLYMEVILYRLAINTLIMCIFAIIVFFREKYLVSGIINTFSSDKAR